MIKSFFQRSHQVYQWYPRIFECFLCLLFAVWRQSWPTRPSKDLSQVIPRSVWKSLILADYGSSVSYEVRKPPAEFILRSGHAWVHLSRNLCHRWVPSRFCESWWRILKSEYLGHLMPQPILGSRLINHEFQGFSMIDFGIETEYFGLIGYVIGAEWVVEPLMFRILTDSCSFLHVRQK